MKGLLTRILDNSPEPMPVMIPTWSLEEERKFKECLGKMECWHKFENGVFHLRPRDIGAFERVILQNGLGTSKVARRIVAAMMKDETESVRFVYG